MEGSAGPEGPTGALKGMNVRGQQDAPVTVSVPFFESFVATHSAQESFENVLADVGCNVPRQDETDQRVIRETRTGTATFVGSVSGLPGLPDSQDDGAGWEEYPEFHRPVDWDTDGDGLPNAWETEHGLSPDNASDGALDPNRDGYTNLEDYLNWLAAGNSLVPNDRR